MSKNIYHFIIFIEMRKNWRREQPKTRRRLKRVEQRWNNSLSAWRLLTKKARSCLKVKRTPLYASLDFLCAIVYIEIYSVLIRLFTYVSVEFLILSVSFPSPFSGWTRENARWSRDASKNNQRVWRCSHRKSEDSRRASTCIGEARKCSSISGWENQFALSEGNSLFDCTFGRLVSRTCLIETIFI